MPQSALSQGDAGPHLIHGSLESTSLHPKLYFDRFKRFSKSHAFNQQTHTHRHRLLVMLYDSYVAFMTL